MENGLLSLFRLDQLADQDSLAQILQTNEQSARYGLRLTAADAADLLDTRRQTLQGRERLEFGQDTIVKLITAFQDSVYLNQQDYAMALHELLDLFYAVQDESMDQLGDDELVTLLKTHFEGECGGSLELLASRELDGTARNLRFSRAGDDYGIDELEQALEAENAADVFANDDYYAGYEYYEGGALNAE